MSSSTTESAPLHSLDVLLVEDNPADARLVEACLAESGIDVALRWERTGDAGLEALREARPDVMLVDLGLPESEGRGSVRRFTKAAPDLAVVAITGRGDMEAVLEALTAGATEYLQKDDLSPGLLARTLRWSVERTRLEREARAQEEMSRSILRSLSDHLAVLDGDGTIVAVNDAWRAFADEEGGDPRGYEGRDYLEVTRRVAEEDEDARRMLRGLRSVLEGERDRFSMEYPCHTPDRRYWFRVSVTPLIGEGRQGAVVSHSDVTERRLVREELEAERARLEDVFRQAPAFIAVLRGPEHVFEMVNPAYRAMVGHRDFLGRPVRDVFPELEGEGFFAALDRVYETGEDVRFEEEPVVLEDPEDGVARERHLTFVYQPRREGGEVVGVIAHGVDVTEQVLARRRVEEAEARWSTVLELAPTAIAISDRETGEYHLVNEACAAVLGSTPDELMGRSVAEIGFWDDPARRDEILGRLEAEGEVQNEVIRFRTLAGELRHGRVSVRALELGGEERLLWTMQDVTKEKERERLLRRSEERYRSLFEDSLEGIALVRPSGDVEAANDTFLELVGYRREQLEDLRFDDLYEDPEDHSSILEAVLEGRGVVDHEVTLRTRSGERRICRVTASLQPAGIGGRGELVQEVVRDVTDRVRLEQELRRQALHDALTGLANRNLFGDRLRQAFAHCQRRREGMGLLLVDLDRFKQVNDHLGHTAGDRVLVEVARRLERSVREQDTAARLGGDEFAVVLEGLTDLSQLETVRERLQVQLGEPYRVGGREVEIDVSMGGVVYGLHDLDQRMDVEESEDLVRYADVALRRAKKISARSFHLFRPDEDRAEASSLGREQELRRAIREGEIDVVFQPIVRLDTGEVWGVEPLARWHHPERGTVSPGEFIPLAEETGLIHELGSLLFRRACQQVTAWDNGRPAPRVTPNMSGRQFDREDLVPTLVEAVEDCRLDPERVWIEVTENAVTRATGTIEELRELGFGLLVDDFGTGYSSFHYLRDLRLDGLKIDMSFVHGLDSDDSSVALVRTMLTMGETMGLVAVAEGIETPAQRDVLQELGCQLGQGYLFARPMPADEMAVHLGAEKRFMGDATGG